MKKISRLMIAMALLTTVSGCQFLFKVTGMERPAKVHLNLPPAEKDELPVVTVRVGEIVPATTAGRSVRGGYWLSVNTADHSIARPVPVDGSFFKGTNIEGISPGRTLALFGNAAGMHSDDDEWIDEGRGTFWIEVVPDYKKELDGL